VSNFALLLLCFASGLVLRRTQRLPEATPAALNGFIVHVSLPALTLGIGIPLSFLTLPVWWYGLAVL